METATKTPKAPKIPLVTQYVGWLRYNSPAPGCMSISGDTLPALIADAFKTASYYAAIPHRVMMLEDLQRVCVACWGDGTVQGVRKRARCKACRGVGVIEKFESIRLTPHENVKVVENYAS